jgi:hypothetical protein
MMCVVVHSYALAAFALRSLIIGFFLVTQALVSIVSYFLPIETARFITYWY